MLPVVITVPGLSSHPVTTDESVLRKQNDTFFFSKARSATLPTIYGRDMQNFRKSEFESSKQEQFP